MTEKDMCISQEQYTALIEGQKDTANQLNNVEKTLEQVLSDGKETRKMITGNGNPETGLAFRVLSLEKLLATHLLGHEDSRKKVWELIAPTLSKIMEYGLAGGLFWVITVLTSK